MLAENFAEQGGGRRNPDGFRERQRSYAEFNATDVKGFYQRIVLNSSMCIKYAQNHAALYVRRDLSGFGQCYLVCLDFYKLLLHICINLVGHV